MQTMKKIWTYLAIAAVAVAAALNYELFVFPNQFAPAGLNGICTMVQHVTGIRVGYLSLFLNVPLAVVCYLYVSKPIALRSMVYVVTFSLALIVLDGLHVQSFAYITENGTSTILGPLVAGVIQGFVYSVLVRASAYTGGTDFIAAIVRKMKPHRSFFSMSFAINSVIAITSFFVYGYQMEPVILCILYCFMSSTMGERLMKSGREAICFQIITDYPQEISNEIIQKLHHTTTMVPAVGMYSGRKTNMLVCVVNKSQAAIVSAIVRSYPSTFAVMDPVGEVMGNFKHLATDGREVKELLDAGDGKTL